ncbi:MAG TPA: sigma-70 family RNA polymerase sigma factor [Gemmataceae bacterium]|nr:sigma-70 family RNA polymerase sigma factor [Gemmataceae bacterium]
METNALPRLQVHTTEAEFAAQLRAVQTRLYAYIYSLVHEFNDADDLFQQTALILWKKFGEFDRERSFFSWACGIARLEVLNFLRNRGRHRLYFSDDLNLLLIEAHEEVAEPELMERRQALATCIAKLRERDQELLLECYQESGGVNQAAERRGRSPQSVFNSLRRIRRALFMCITRATSPASRPEWIR